MTHHFNVSGEDRKKLVNTISTHLGIPAKYLGTPSYAYQIGSYTVSKDGELSWGDMDDADPAHLEESTVLLQKLEEAGFHSDETSFLEEQQEAIESAEADGADSLSVSMPRENFTDETLDNLRRLISAKGTLMKRAFQISELPLEVDEEKVTFPWFHVFYPAQAMAYTTFVQAICEMATKQTRISAKEKDIVNEKYEFRCFLLRLGMIGDEYKQTRKILLENLSGSAAFKSGHKKGGEQNVLS